MKNNRTKPATGTYEWAGKTVNIYTGCKNGCLYCYARFNAVFRYKTVRHLSDWEHMVIMPWRERSYTKFDSVVMFPSLHDIFPWSLPEAKALLEVLLGLGNKVLIVTKPRYSVIKEICDNFYRYKNQILFRFTIGSLDNTVLKFWEPGAPDIQERISSLGYAFKTGFNTSISCEPLLTPNAPEIFYQLKPSVSHSIWFGGLNDIEHRVNTREFDAAGMAMVDQAIKARSSEQVLSYYEALKNEPLVRWKDSFIGILKLSGKEVKNPEVKDPMDFI